jgi:hypothetical protein
MRFATVLKISALVVLIAGGGFIGYRLGSGSVLRDIASSEAAKAPETEAQQVATGSAPVSKGPDVAAQAPGRGPASVAANAATGGTFEAMVKERGLSGKMNDLAKAFPQTEAGQKVARMATLLQFGPATRSPEGQLVAGEVDWLREHAGDAFKAIQEGLPHVGADYAHERQYLLQFAGGLEVDERQKMDFLTSELNRSMGDSKNYDGAAALGAMLQASRSPDDVEMALRHALELQKDSKMRDVLLTFYSSHEPERSQRLRAEFGQ